MDIIAIDCGASFIKATRFINGKIFRSIRQKTPLDTDADKLEKSLSMIKAMIEELSNDVSEIAIGFSMRCMDLCLQMKMVYLLCLIFRGKRTGKFA